MINREYSLKQIISKLDDNIIIDIRSCDKFTLPILMVRKSHITVVPKIGHVFSYNYQCVKR